MVVPYIYAPRNTHIKQYFKQFTFVFTSTKDLKRLLKCKIAKPLTDVPTTILRASGHTCSYKTFCLILKNAKITGRIFEKKNKQVNTNSSRLGLEDWTELNRISKSLLRCYCAPLLAKLFQLFYSCTTERRIY